jgi:hypothetical protein
MGRGDELHCVSLTFMATDHILALLMLERDKLTEAIEALQDPVTTGKTPGPGRKAVLPSVEQDSPPRMVVGPTAPVKRKMSAAGRRAIIAATKKRWAAVREAKAAAAPKAPSAKTPVSVKKGGLTEVGRKALSLAMKRRWAAKKKAAAKGKAA